MQQRGHRGGAVHGAKQPGREWGLAGLRGGRDKDAERSDGEKTAVQVCEVREGQASGSRVAGERGEKQSEIAQPRRHERESGRPCGLRLPPAVADERPRARAHDLPADQQRDEVRRAHHELHRANEDQQQSHEPGQSGLRLVKRGEDQHRQTNHRHGKRHRPRRVGQIQQQGKVGRPDEARRRRLKRAQNGDPHHDRAAEHSQSDAARRAERPDHQTGRGRQKGERPDHPRNVSRLSVTSAWRRR